MRVAKITERELAKFKAELIIMAPLHHPHLVRLWGGVWNEGADKLCIVLEFCLHGALTAFLRRDVPRAWDEELSWDALHHGLALGVAKSLSYLHHDLSEPLIHRDIKPDNVLVSVDVVAKVADFGESTRFDGGVAKKEGDDRRHSNEGDVLTMTMVGTQAYCAPEVITGQRYNESAASCCDRPMLLSAHNTPLTLVALQFVQDTFSFALLLLCLATCNIKHVSDCCCTRRLTTTTYANGWRPEIPVMLDFDHPELVVLIRSMWQTDFRMRPAMMTAVQALANLVPVISNDEGGVIEREVSSNRGANLLSDEAIEGARQRHESSPKSFAAFLSHHKEACATEARLVKQNYETLLGVECFLGKSNDHIPPSYTMLCVLTKALSSAADSDNLRDLRVLVDHVKDSDALILFQSKEVLQRPWCLIELSAAITHGVPIVALSCVGKKYDFVSAVDFLLHLETCLETLNPSALVVLKKNNVDPLQLAHKLHSVIPNIISIPLNTSASDNAIKASMADLVKAVQGAEPLSIEESFESWLASRKTMEQLVLEQALDSGTIRGTQRGRMLMKVERADEMAAENAELKRTVESERANFKTREADSNRLAAEREAQLKTELKEERARRECERDQHKTELARAVAKCDARIEKLETKIERLEAKLEG